MPRSLLMRALLALALAATVATGCSDDGDPSTGQTSTNNATTSTNNATTSTSTNASTTSPDAGGDTGDDAGDDTSDGGDPDTGPAVAWCDGPTAQIHDPASDDIDIWPDAHYEREDATSPTGVRVGISDHPFLEKMAEPLRPFLATVDAATGYGVNTSVYFRLTEPLDSLPADADASVTDAGLIFIELDDANNATRVPFEVTLAEEGRALLLKPVKPLKVGTRYAAIMTTEATSQGDCVAPSQATRDALTGVAGEDFARSTAQWNAALEAQGLAWEDVSAITTFTTQNVLGLFAEIADEIDGNDYAWTVREPCVDEAEWRRCELFYNPVDYRDGEVVQTVQNQGRNQVPVSVWLPLEADGPVLPVVLGHGASTGRGLGEEVAEILVPEGFAVIAAEALEHGEHPIRGGGENPDPDMDFVRFLGIDLSQMIRLNGLGLQGNFNQSALEWAQLVRLIKLNGDLDGDGTPELESERVGYLGLSLGAILGSAVLTVSDDVDAAFFSVGGGWLSAFVSSNEQVGEYLPLLRPLVGGDERFERFLIIAQTGLDQADPALWGNFIFQDRIHGDRAPHMSMSVTIHDEIVPYATGRALAHAFGSPQVGPVFIEVPLMETVEAPVAGNIDSVTRGYMQFDEVTLLDGRRVPAGHQDLPRSQEGRAQVVHYFRTWRETGTPEFVLPVLD